MINLRCHELAVSFYREARDFYLPAPLADQWKRASASIALNLAEGYGKRTPKDRARYFRSALGSIRECQSVVAMEQELAGKFEAQLDSLAAMVWRLLNP
jgi:four helix bundle protein